MEEDAWLWPHLKGAVERKGGRLEERTKRCPAVAKKGFQGNGCHISRRLWRSLALSSKYARAVKSFLDLQDDSSSLVQS